MTLQMCLVVFVAFAMSLAESQANFQNDIDNMWGKINDIYDRTETCKEEIETLSGEIANIANSPSVDNTGLKCESGTFAAHSHPIRPKWPVNKNIQFKVPFSKAPAVTYGIYVLDSQHDTNVRAVAKINQVNSRGFQLQLTTWAGTVQWGLGVSWMACPSQ